MVFSYRRQNSWFRKGICSLLTVCLSFGLVLPPSYAQLLPNLPAPGQSVKLTPEFQPPILKGMIVHPENPLLFDFIVDRGDDKLDNQPLKTESEKLIKYFLASMTIPDKDAWVNLSPYEKDRIIPDTLGSTEMGRQMLEQDYILKQLASSLTDPDTELGQRYWTEIRRRAQIQFGTTDLSFDSVSKVWIVPDGATVVEKDGFAYITESKLKVMLEADYLALSQTQGTPGHLDTSTPVYQSSENSQGVPVSQVAESGQGVPSVLAVSKLTTDVFRELILPELVKEVNFGKNFAKTRQVYQSVVLATWYKQALKDSLLVKIYADKAKVKGVETDDKEIKQKVYEQYLQAFKKGVYNLIKEDVEESGEIIPRKYFSGGFVMSLVGAGVSLNVDQRRTAVSAAVAELFAGGDRRRVVRVFGSETLPEAGEIQKAAAKVATQTLSSSTAVATISGQQAQQKFQYFHEMEGLFESRKGEFRNGWFVGFDLDKGTAASIKEGMSKLNVDIGVLNELIIQALSSKRASFFGTKRVSNLAIEEIEAEFNYEEGFVYIPQDVSPNELNNLLQGILREFKETTGKSVTFATFQAADIEAATLNGDGLENIESRDLYVFNPNKSRWHLQTVENVIERLLRKAKGSKDAPYDENYGNKVVTYADWKGRLLAPAFSAAAAAGASSVDNSMVARRTPSPAQFQDYEQMAFFLEKTQGVSPRGWWLTFDLDKGSDISDSDRPGVIAKLDRIIIEKLGVNRAANFFKTFSTERLYEQEEGYIYLPDEITREELIEILDQIRTEFRQEGQLEQVKRTVSFGVLNSDDIEHAASSRYGVLMERLPNDPAFRTQRIISKVLNNLVREAKGYKDALYDDKYGDKTVFYAASPRETDAEGAAAQPSSTTFLEIAKTFVYTNILPNRDIESISQDELNLRLAPNVNVYTPVGENNNISDISLNAFLDETARGIVTQVTETVNAVGGVVFRANPGDAHATLFVLKDQEEFKSEDGTYRQASRDEMTYEKERVIDNNVLGDIRALPFTVKGVHLTNNGGIILELEPPSVLEGVLDRGSQIAVRGSISPFFYTTVGYLQNGTSVESIESLIQVLSTISEQVNGTVVSTSEIAVSNEINRWSAGERDTVISSAAAAGENTSDTVTELKLNDGKMINVGSGRKIFEAIVAIWKRNISDNTRQALQVIAERVFLQPYDSLAAIRGTGIAEGLVWDNNYKKLRLENNLLDLTNPDVLNIFHNAFAYNDEGKLILVDPIAESDGGKGKEYEESKLLSDLPAAAAGENTSDTVTELKLNDGKMINVGSGRKIFEAIVAIWKRNISDNTRQALQVIAERVFLQPYDSLAAIRGIGIAEGLVWDNNYKKLRLENNLLDLTNPDVLNIFHNAFAYNDEGKLILVDPIAESDGGKGKVYDESRLLSDLPAAAAQAKAPTDNSMLVPFQGKPKAAISKLEGFQVLAQRKYEWGLTMSKVLLADGKIVTRLEGGTQYNANNHAKRGKAKFIDLPGDYFEMGLGFIENEFRLKLSFTNSQEYNDVLKGELYTIKSEFYPQTGFTYHELRKKDGILADRFTDPKIGNTSHDPGRAIMRRFARVQAAREGGDQTDLVEAIRMDYRRVMAQEEIIRRIDEIPKEYRSWLDLSTSENGILVVTIEAGGYEYKYHIGDITAFALGKVNNYNDEFFLAQLDPDKKPVFLRFRREIDLSTGQTQAPKVERVKLEHLPVDVLREFNVELTEDQKWEVAAAINPYNNLGLGMNFYVAMEDQIVHIIKLVGDIDFVPYYEIGDWTEDQVRLREHLTELRQSVWSLKWAEYITALMEDNPEIARQILNEAKNGPIKSPLGYDIQEYETALTNQAIKEKLIRILKRQNPDEFGYLDEDEAAQDADSLFYSDELLRADLAVLGLNVGATRKEVVDARRELTSKYHPDYPSNWPKGVKTIKEAGQKLQEVNDAYGRLKKHPWFRDRSEEGPVEDKSAGGSVIGNSNHEPGARNSDPSQLSETQRRAKFNADIKNAIRALTNMSYDPLTDSIEGVPGPDQYAFAKRRLNDYQLFKTGAPGGVNFQQEIKTAIVNYVQSRGRELTDEQQAKLDSIAETFIKKIEEFVLQYSAQEAARDGKAAQTTTSAPGGIDFDPSKLDLQIKRDGKGVPLPMSEQNLDAINLEGLYPVIINILPINAQTLPVLGQLDAEAQTTLAKNS